MSEIFNYIHDSALSWTVTLNVWLSWLVCYWNCLPLFIGAIRDFSWDPIRSLHYTLISLLYFDSAFFCCAWNKNTPCWSSKNGEDYYYSCNNENDCQSSRGICKAHYSISMTKKPFINIVYLVVKVISYHYALGIYSDLNQCLGLSSDIR